MGQPSPDQWQSTTTSALTATIASGQTVSQAIDLQGTFLTGLVVPANFDGTQIQFLASRDGTDTGLGAYAPYYNAAGTRVTIVVTAATLSFIGLSPQDFSSIRYLKLVSVTTQTTTPTVIGLVTRPLS